MAANSIAKLPGELVVAEAHRTQCLIQYTENQESGGKGGGGTAVSGTLSCTNYCFHFEPDAAQGLARLGQYISSQLAGSRRVPLGCVREIYMIVGGRKKILEGHATLPRKISEIEIICVDLRRLVFSVKQCPKNEASSILNALVRHTNPSSLSLLFAFDFARATRQRRPSQTNDSAPLFLGVRDWQRELTRLGVAGDQWRISDSNKEFLICDSLCPFLVVPANSRDNTLDYVASLHHGNRLPVWCWSHPNTGVSLTRGGAPSIDDPSEAPDPSYMYAVSMARNIGHQIENKGTATLDITRTCGTVWDLRSAFSNMRDLSMPGSPQELAGLDRKWLTGMESAGWLPMVRNCLRLAKTVSQNLCIDHRPVFLQEEGGRDLSCVVSSLAQLMMDPHYRSISGFQALVQKDWVAMGHPFSTRHHLITKPPSLSPDSVTDEPSVEVNSQHET
ncbi:Myotubularin-related protein 10-A [Geodia barretti]|uniref:Myotubularin-related protein 10-A n=1 Tax=Geodia barretti TaxID=519541 RepID=A0AA35VY98_GEOBA|nr:Myotubularin-related protein 10-A [Geodia barretti]